MIPSVNSNKTGCPTGQMLTGLVHGDLPDDRQADLAEHVGGCVGCQTRLDAIATAGDPKLSDVIRHIDKSDPPSDSAFWKALGNAEVAVTPPSLQPPHRLT